MTTDVATLGIKVDTTQVQQAITVLASLTTQAQKTETQTKAVGTAATTANTSIGRFTSGISSAINGLKAYVAALGINELIQYSNTWQQISNRVTAATSSQQEAAAALNVVYDISQKTRVDLESTAQLYQRLGPLAQDVGQSQANMLRVVQTVEEALVAGGSSAQQATSAVYQLSEALGSGQLNGRQLRSIVLDSQVLSKSLADGLTQMGKFGTVGVADLKNLGETGQLTASVVVKAWLSQSAAMDTFFGKMPATIGQAMTQVNNAFTRWIGLAGQTSGLQKEMVNGLQYIASNFDTIAAKVIKAVEVVGGLWLTAIGVEFVQKVAAAGVAVFNFAEEIGLLTLSGGLVGAAIAAVTALVVAIAVYGDKWTVIKGQTATYFDYAIAIWNLMKEGAIADLTEIWNYYAWVFGQMKTLAVEVGQTYKDTFIALKNDSVDGLQSVANFLDTWLQKIPGYDDAMVSFGNSTSAVADDLGNLFKAGATGAEKAVALLNNTLQDTATTAKEMGDVLQDDAQGVHTTRAAAATAAAKPTAFSVNLGPAASDLAQLNKANPLTWWQSHKTDLESVVKSVSSNITDTLGSALTDPWQQGETAAQRFANTMSSILRDIAKEIVETFAIKPAVNGLGNGLMSFLTAAGGPSISGLFGGSSAGATSAAAAAGGASASDAAVLAGLSFRGNVLAHGSFVRHSQGGVVSSLGAFPMSGGRVGTIGENGPEAIVPLKRDSSGNLGVASNGGSGGIVINNYVTVQSNSQESGQQQGQSIAKQLSDIMDVKIATAMKKQLRPGGILSKSATA